MGKAILFDLDGTLLPVDTEKFVEQYIKAISPQVQDFFKHPGEFTKILWDSTHDMIRNDDPNLTNEEVFTRSFLEKTGIQKSDIWPFFDRFYVEHFPKLKEYTEPTEISKEIVHIAKEQGRKVLIATNPVFPKTAIYERLRWLELEDFPFDLVTVYEESHFCKPQLHYYKEALRKVGIDPKDAIMVGNDVQEDMVASELGIKTYLVTDYQIDRGNSNYNIDQRGTLIQLKEQIREKQGIFAL